MTSTAPASAPPRDPSHGPLSVVSMTVPDPTPTVPAVETGTGVAGRFR